MPAGMAANGEDGRAVAERWATDRHGEAGRGPAAVGSIIAMQIRGRA